jgi:hypothetical protein
LILSPPLFAERWFYHLAMILNWCFVTYFFIFKKKLLVKRNYKHFDRPELDVALPRQQNVSTKCATGTNKPSWSPLIIDHDFHRIRIQVIILYRHSVRINHRNQLIWCQLPPYHPGTKPLFATSTFQHQQHFSDNWIHRNFLWLHPLLINWKNPKSKLLILELLRSHCWCNPPKPIRHPDVSGRRDFLPIGKF